MSTRAVDIPLTRGKVAQVDAPDLPLLLGYSWIALAAKNGRWYAQARVPGGGGRNILMHRLLVPGAPQVDHWNNDGLDNRRENLRPATQSLNNANRGKYPRKKSGMTSHYKGVSRGPQARKWRVQICCDGRRRTLGYFADEVTAARAYNAEAFALFGEYCRRHVLLARAMRPRMARLRSRVPMSPVRGMQRRGQAHTRGVRRMASQDLADRIIAAGKLRDIIIRAHGMATGRHVQSETERLARIARLLDNAIDDDPIMRGFLGRGGPMAELNILGGSGSLDG